MQNIAADELLNRRVPKLSMLSDAALDDQDLSGLQVECLRFSRCRFTRCRFDRAVLEDLRAWDSSFEDCSFRDANLRSFSFGGASDGRFNRFARCDFSGADLRGASTGPAEMADCRFIKTNLRKVEFNGTRLTDTVFSGPLWEVAFHERAFGCPDAPPNQMLRVDFSGAVLRGCDFRGLNLDTIVVPQDPSHVIVRELGTFLPAAIHRYSALAPCPDLVVMLRHIEKWRGPNQRTAILNLKDYAKTLPPEEAEHLRRLAEAQ